MKDPKTKIQNTIIRKLENTWVIWFFQSKSFVLFEEPANDVFRLYSEGVDFDKIVTFCETKYGHLEENISQFVEEIIHEIDHFNNPENKVSIAINPPEEITEPKFSSSQITSYKIGRKTISVAYQNEHLKFAIHPVIAHLEDKQLQSVDNKIGVFEKDGILYFTHKGKIIEAFLKEDIQYFSGCVKQLMFSILYERDYSDWMMALHASGVSRNGQAVVFSAAAGSGKSTISALLKAKAYNFLSDDFITADEKGNVYSFPAAISVKDGSVEALSEFSPELKEISTQETFIGKIVRYLSVENLSGNYESGFPVKAFVFVNYDKQSESIIEEVTKKEALQHLLKETWVKPEPENIERFFDWIENTNFYRLQYSDNQQAIDFVQKLFDPNLIYNH
jgi:hypothetical protein